MISLVFDGILQIVRYSRVFLTQFLPVDCCDHGLSSVGIHFLCLAIFFRRFTVFLRVVDGAMAEADSIDRFRFFVLSRGDPYACDPHALLIVACMPDSLPRRSFVQSRATKLRLFCVGVVSVCRYI